MREIFVDSAHYIAVLNRRDGLHQTALRVARLLENEPVRFVTTDAVLVEVLTHQSGFGAEPRQIAANLVDLLNRRQLVEIVPQTPALFASGVDLYRQRLDKSYSMVDCMSMVVCRERDIRDVLTADRDFAQEGFTILL